MSGRMYFLRSFRVTERASAPQHPTCGWILVATCFSVVPISESRLSYLNTFLKRPFPETLTAHRQHWLSSLGDPEKVC